MNRVPGPAGCPLKPPNHQPLLLNGERERGILPHPQTPLRRWREPSDRTTTCNFDADQTRLGSGGWLGLGPFGHPLLGLVTHTQTHGVEGARQQRGRPNETNERPCVPKRRWRNAAAYSSTSPNAAKYAGVEEGAWRRRRLKEEGRGHVRGLVGPCGCQWRERRGDRRSSQSQVRGGIHSKFFSSFIQRCSEVSVRRAVLQEK